MSFIKSIGIANMMGAFRSLSFSGTNGIVDSFSSNEIYY
jgi:hypothetical protein